MVKIKKKKHHIIVGLKINKQKIVFLLKKLANF